MNPQERALLVRFLDQLDAAQAGRKDAEAEALIREACARQPDADYLLVQRALQLEQALQITQAEAVRLQSELDRLRDGGSFLGSANAWGRAPASSADTAPSGAPISRAPGTVQPSQPAGASPSPSGPGWSSGMLGNVAATAAGVVAGSFIYQGVQNLLGRHGMEAPWGTANLPPLPDDSAAIDDLVENTPADDSFDTTDGDGDGGDFA